MEYNDYSNTIVRLIDTIALKIVCVYADKLINELGSMPELNDGDIMIKSLFNVVTNEIDYNLMGRLGRVINNPIVRIKLPMDQEVPTDDELNNDLRVRYEELRLLLIQSKNKASSGIDV